MENTNIADELFEIDGDEFVLTIDDLSRLGIALQAWSSLTRGRRGAQDEMECLPGRRLSHDLDLASRLASRVMNIIGKKEGTTFDLRIRYGKEDSEYERDSEIARRVVKRSLEGAVFEHWTYKLLPRGESGCNEDLIARAARAGDFEARLLLKRGCEVEALIFKRHGMVIKGDSCVPESPEATRAAEEALVAALGPKCASICEGHRHLIRAGRYANRGRNETI
jgi:hypothetical protein